MILLCLAAIAIDGDTIRCQDGTRIRLHGIEAAELHGGCHLPACPAMSGPEARDWMRRQVDGQDLRYEPVGKSYRRVVAVVALPDGRDLSCLAIQAGVAVRWDKFDRGGRLRGC
ncbi:thermonuclease family protein [Sphingomonas histidinilytica]|uniref:thermonuclease family protein n=1 Tax=Rhizorhabdus histidinilytica TaxID=439228 RepID=UPI001ADA16D8|nr:thermonuclease family protein [Rhizorhabdus histidinilytica]